MKIFFLFCHNLEDMNEILKKIHLKLELDLRFLHSGKITFLLAIPSMTGIKGQLSGHSLSSAFLSPFVFFILRFESVIPLQAPIFLLCLLKLVVFNQQKSPVSSGSSS